MKVTICYICGNKICTSIIAISEDRRKVEEAMHEWCNDRNITPEYIKGNYHFQNGKIGGWIIFEEMEMI